MNRDLAGHSGAGAAARQSIRAGATGPTSGLAPGLVQANLIAVPADWAFDMLLFAQRNPKPCPIVDVLEPGQVESALAPGSDLRTDIPGYRVWENGSLIDEVTDATEIWQTHPDLVSFLIGCSFTFESGLIDAGIPIRHQEAGRNVPMYRTSTACRPAGKISGDMVVSMRPIPAHQVAEAVRITDRFPAVHGAPVHVGDPAQIGISDLDSPDFGDAPVIVDGDIPVFWACGVTPQAAVQASAPPFAVTHSPGKMFITDEPEDTFRR
ncbi:MAG: putative hydro-lyase [Brevibacterium sp.]|uniref:putative hydro-lyase n=1 Tax=Brevibacterium sp. TaxID=1701 RepID=UPI0026496B6A|nr:putative hydro-lyase [Brevibacterium sp.]MDN5806378.1 putative hydro-lyase [Brevibacterium sp.]MDN5832861.1 putative hydro-lyase [Brevibacterium sp.]MDN5875296.1 putative hydro-lyase [Brevibacterium sp.]MDN5908043.1 putative hydro-lyase [Brevibacterium sp.]MDN6133201.1 putative hydro-lyase [Brevibacterium sp.]